MNLNLCILRMFEDTVLLGAKFHSSAVLQVEPYNPQWSDVKHCKCKTTDGQCGGCNVFGKIYSK